MKNKKNDKEEKYCLCSFKKYIFEENIKINNGNLVGSKGFLSFILS